MSQQPVWAGSTPRISDSREPARSGANLADILERVLDKGIVIAGDIRIDLLDIELLTIKIRLLVASVDRAREMGIDWWEHDPALSSRSRDAVQENERLRRRIGELEAGRSTGPALDGEAEQRLPADRRRAEEERRPADRRPTEDQQRRPAERRRAAGPHPAEPHPDEQSRTEQNRDEQSRTEQSRTEQSRTAGHRPAEPHTAGRPLARGRRRPADGGRP